MADKVRVSIIKCNSYKNKHLKKAIAESVGLLGGFKKFVKPGDRVLIKPNLLSPSAPEKAITTHPAFITAVIEELLECTGEIKNITLADSSSPAVPFKESGIKKVYKQAGILEVSRETGIKLNYSTEYQSISNKEGRTIKKIEVIKPALEADVIINLSKFKTHNLTVLTGAVKNMFGVVPGFTKVGYHLRFDNTGDFVGMLFDLITLVRPALNIMDGITGMEGEGPGSGGTPREIGLILASSDSISLDTVMGRIINLDEDLNPFIKTARERGISSAELDNIEIMGEKIENIIMDDFKLPGTAGQQKLVENNFINTYIMPFVKSSLNPYPYIDESRCTLCLTCRDVCPTKSITESNGKLKFDYRKCIRCFCCSEMCPEGAFDIKYSFLGNLLLNRLGLSGRAGKKTG